MQWLGCLTTVLLAATALAGPIPESQPDNAGPFKLRSASLLGGPADDQIVSVAIADNAAILVGNTAGLKLPAAETVIAPDAPVADAQPPADPKAAKGWKHPSLCGFVLRLELDGKTPRGLTRFGHGTATILNASLDSRGALWLLGSAGHEMELGGVTGKGAFVAQMSGDFARVQACVFVDGATDFGVDSNGELVVLSGANLTRYSADLKNVLWKASWKAHGANHPGGMALDATTGITAVIGYGMAHTGKEPYKDPYACGFDRAGRQVWALWNPDPSLEKAAQFGGNGLMADTTGHAAAVGEGGKFLLMLFADGGNTIASRDPSDPGKPLDKAVMDGVFQKTAGYGFRGASKTSVIFRADAASGALEKGTFMCAWLDPSHANGLGIENALADGDGRVMVVGGSASGCPTRLPWYTAVEGGYKGGGFLAVFDKDFKMLQCGYFPAASIACVAQRDGWVLIAGSAAKPADSDAAPGKTVKVGSATTKIGAVADHVRLYKPLQGTFGGGNRDAYFAILKAGS